MDSTPHDIAVGGWVSLGFSSQHGGVSKFNAAPPPTIKCKGGGGISKRRQSGRCVSRIVARATQPPTLLQPFQGLALRWPLNLPTFSWLCGALLQDYVFSKNSGALWNSLEFSEKVFIQILTISQRILDRRYAKIIRTYENYWFLICRLRFSNKFWSSLALLGVPWESVFLSLTVFQRSFELRYAKIAKTYENYWFLHVLEALMHAWVHPKLFRLNWTSPANFGAWAPRFKVLYNTQNIIECRSLHR